MVESAVGNKQLSERGRCSKFKNEKQRDSKREKQTVKKPETQHVGGMREGLGEQGNAGAGGAQDKYDEGQTIGGSVSQHQHVPEDVLIS